MPASLPQKDSKVVQDLRQGKLTIKQRRYQYSIGNEPILPMLRSLPGGALPSPRWLALVAESALKILLNTIKVKIKKDSNLLSLLEIYLNIQAEFRSNNSNDKELQSVLRMLDDERITGSGKDLNEYNSLFQTIRLPEISSKFTKDSEFARMRVAGPNPVVIKRLDKKSDDFPVSNQMFESVMPGKSDGQGGTVNDNLDKAIQEKRVYVADYAILANVENGSFPDQQKFLSAPLALFAVPLESRSLIPVAIQWDQNSKNVITPSGNDAWEFAKTIVQIADANYHELISHLGLTHLLIEPFAIATERQLASAHPLGILLRPHFEGTFFINNLAHRFLINDNGPVDELLAGTASASRKLAAQAASSLDFNASILPSTFKHRGVDDTNALPDYPYRDDSLDIWNAIHQWVSEYLSIYYQNNNDITDDYELQAWIKELISNDGGKIKGIGENGKKISTLAYLIDVATQIIFTASAQHAAVNFPQASIMSYTPAIPLAGYTPIPDNFPGNVSQEDYFNLLPPIKQAQGQLNVTYLLGSVYYTKLGDYFNLIDDEVQKPLRKFQDNLKLIEAKIIERNQKNPDNSYEYLSPSKIPQSINI